MTEMSRRFKTQMARDEDGIRSRWKRSRTTK